MYTFILPAMTHKASSDHIEVEIRAKLDAKQVETCLATLKIQHAQQQSTEKLIDVYFCKNDVTDFSQIAMNETGSFSLRLRQREKDEKKDTELNIKVITTYGDHNAWEEHETTVSSLEETYTILQRLGYKAFFKLKKIRTSYYLADLNMTVNLEDIEEFGYALEVEIITSEQASEKAKQNIKTYLTSLGVTPDQIIQKTITNMMMQTMSRFDGSVEL